MSKPATILCIAAVFLGLISPFIAGVFANGPLHGWFFLLPTAVDQLLWPEGEVRMLVLATLVFILQYFALFAFLAASIRFAAVVRDFLRRDRRAVL